MTLMTAKRSPEAAGRPRLTPIDRIDSSIFFKLVRVVNLTARPFVETLSKAHQLSLNEWRAMVVLASHPGVAAREVAEYTGLDKMSVSRAIAALDHHARIRKEPDPADARCTRLWLNTAGQALFQTIAPLAAERELQLFGGIGTAELQRLGETIDRLIDALQTATAADETA